jgi:D-amino-acid dehydrogenase
MKQSVFVLGAGMVGISCALELQRRGYPVTLIDRRGPGEETSSGNAGVLSYSNVTPIASPELLGRLHHLIFNRDADLLLHYPHLPSLIPWLVRFLSRCRRKIFLTDGDAMSVLTLASIEVHKQWIAEASAQHLLNQGGGLKLYRDRRTFMRGQLERELLQRCGIKHTLLEADQIYDYEPDLKRIFVQAVLIDETVSIRNPEKLCKAYAQMFIEAGGQVRRAEIKSLRPANGAWELTTGQGTETVARLVVCMGAWTPELIGQLGYSNPLAIERGYHTILAPADDASLSRPIFDVDGSYVMSSMDMGLRVTTGSNLVHHEIAPDPRQVIQVMPRVREAFPIDKVLLREPWMGRRPTAPDSLPIIGPAPRHENLWLAFGHSHMGFTMGPITGQLIANDISGAEQPFALTACSPARYL